ncbi:Acetyl-Coenzyme A Synthetase, Cytoplasmic [Manis pentadactyla]|nr:Acetyl-Coenzyme A Synthetase, Cytoplasmic [Manis pentadactyla]
MLRRRDLQESGGRLGEEKLITRRKQYLKLFILSDTVGVTTYKQEQTGLGNAIRNFSPPPSPFQTHS